MIPINREAAAFNYGTHFQGVILKKNGGGEYGEKKKKTCQDIRDGRDREWAGHMRVLWWGEQELGQCERESRVPRVTA